MRYVSHFRSLLHLHLDSLKSLYKAALQNEPFSCSSSFSYSSSFSSTFSFWFFNTNIFHTSQIWTVHFCSCRKSLFAERAPRAVTFHWIHLRQTFRAAHETRVAAGSQVINKQFAMATNNELVHHHIIQLRWRILDMDGDDLQRYRLGPSRRCACAMPDWRRERNANRSYDST